MKTKTFVLTTILFLLSVSTWAIEEVKRTISKEFSVSANDEIIVINKYGNLTISEWGKNKVSFTVEITGRGEKAQVAQELADRVSVNFNKNGKKNFSGNHFPGKKFQLQQLRYIGKLHHQCTHGRLPEFDEQIR